jgi:hypothetical protein
MDGGWAFHKTLSMTHAISVTASNANIRNTRSRIMSYWIKMKYINATGSGRERPGTRIPRTIDGLCCRLETMPRRRAVDLIHPDFIVTEDVIDAYIVRLAQ